jgi:Zn finger protein HypA/HybF involved in hydrogenase expression
MGSFLDADCTCGYRACANVGAGMETFMSECWFPFYCPQCRALVNADTMAAAPVCPECASAEIVPYSDPSLAGELGARDVVSWKQGGDAKKRLSLSDGSYLCPGCKTKSLRFRLSCGYD